jgi:hypothetical protein
LIIFYVFNTGVSLDAECVRELEDWDELFENEEISAMMNKYMAM